MSRKCTICGKENYDDARFCVYCGNDMQIAKQKEQEPEEIQREIEAIKEIVIESGSGYTMLENAYSETITINSTQISYKYNPFEESHENQYCEWTHHDHSNEYGRLFKELKMEMPYVMRTDKSESWLDIGQISFTVTFLNGNKRREAFSLPLDCFNKVLSIVAKMIPSNAIMPKCLPRKTFSQIICEGLRAVKYDGPEDNRLLKAAVNDLANDFPQEKKLFMRNADDQFLQI